MPKSFGQLFKVIEVKRLSRTILSVKWTRMLIRLATVQLAFVLLLPDLARSQIQVQPYPDPGYRRLGVYAGGPDSYFDYRLLKLSLGGAFPNKKEYWAGLKSDEKRLKSPRRHDIYFVYCGERSDSLETVKSRVDAWLKPEADIGTYPKLIAAEHFISRTSRHCFGQL